MVTGQDWSNVFPLSCGLAGFGAEVKAAGTRVAGEAGVRIWSTEDRAMNGAPCCCKAYSLCIIWSAPTQLFQMHFCYMPACFCSTIWSYSLATDPLRGSTIIITAKVIN